METNPVSGGSWSDTSSLTSTEYNTSGTWTLGTPIQLYRTYVSSSELISRIDLTNINTVFITAGVKNGSGFVSDVLVITARKITVSGTDRDVEVSLGWIETI